MCQTETQSVSPISRLINDRRSMLSFAVIQCGVMTSDRLNAVNRNRKYSRVSHEWKNIYDRILLLFNFQLNERNLKKQTKFILRRKFHNLCDAWNVGFTFCFAELRVNFLFLNECHCKEGFTRAAKFLSSHIKIF